MTQARAPRADAVRNRKKILAAARHQITLHGPGVGMDEIAAAAEVAVGTLYRHFPTKTDLVGAVVAESIGEVADDAEAAQERVESGANAMQEVEAFIGRTVEASARDRVVKTAAQALGAASTDTAEEARARAALATLITAAQTSGDLHPDVTVEDFYLLLSTAPSDRPSEARARWLTLTLPGLTSRGRAPHG
ncbi:TetR/AcrR family transcriptional regulator [Streptomyces phaeochromogenes]|uniref:TetR/AcrR family transcriptional regulator n=1 Tax=Streptomyces phaeochromogenes TaxID=1923 RepID=UPI0022552701|nr:TetR/AcrR family transcriptional regulator [Streptomyces phaeochromogenes]MCX5602368.1 TetR/AcrR family transcriptional regulator [Streptomyces phaeochromogenes]